MFSNRILILIVLLMITFVVRIFSGQADNFDNIKKINTTNIPAIPHNNCILDHSTRTVDTEYEKKIKGILYRGNRDVLNIVKYLDSSVEWKEAEVQQQRLDEICSEMYSDMLKKLEPHNIGILYSKLNSHRSHSNDMLMDFDFVLYDPKDFFAYHINVICVINKEEMTRHFLYIELIGKISEDKIHKINDGTCDDIGDSYARVSFPRNHIEDKKQEQGNDGTDDEIRRVMYKVMHGDSNVDHPDYKKNIEHTINQGIVSDMFKTGLRTGKKSSCNHRNVYKNYPYPDDIVIINNYID